MKTYDKILAHTKEVILAQGVDAVSGRQICEDLGINVSSIHYHFGDKEKLIRIALQQLTNETLNFTQMLYEADVRLEQRFQDFFCRLLGLLMLRPEIARQIVAGKFKYPTEPHQVTINPLLIHLKEQLMQEGVDLSSDQLRMRIFQVISAIAYPAEIGIFAEFTEEQRSRYVGDLVRQLLMKA